ncbi:DUF2182 domain-containing protein [Mesorhizobium sp. NPDC059054]|uniref:DUF2182 domain-containing protein n=1 Tax=Mesorhizobium sp. NPDC059054 TaxID=3346711 RepID=UPI0036A2CDFB
MTGQSDDFSHLDRVGRAVAGVGAKPRYVVVAVLGGAVLLAWLLLAGMAMRGAQAGLAGSVPGGSLLRDLPTIPLPTVLERFVALCVGPAPFQAYSISQFSALATMWFLMAVATMLPSAAPMIRTYCEIADTARIKGEPVVHPLILVAGYLAVWLVASLAFAGLTLGLQAIAPDGQAFGPASGVAAAVLLGAAGLYQFSGLKEACLKKCRRPFSILFARWSDKPQRIFRLGTEQGIWCLGCCWALMLVMFAVGIMNLFWMVLLGLFALLEKQVNGRLPSRIAGVILLVWATALLLVSLC